MCMVASLTWWVDRWVVARTTFPSYHVGTCAPTPPFPQLMHTRTSRTHATLPTPTLLPPPRPSLLDKPAFVGVLSTFVGAISNLVGVAKEAADRVYLGNFPEVNCSYLHQRLVVVGKYSTLKDYARKQGSRRVCTRKRAPGVFPPSQGSVLGHFAFRGGLA